MTTFYYVAVSTSARRKMAGKIESASEKDARMELNKMGLAILTLATEKPADFKETKVSTDTTTFEFVAKDKFAKEVNGTIDAADREAAYDRLISEFHFEVSAIYPSTASAEEKAKAVQEGIQPILDLKAKRKAEEDNTKKRTLRGGLESLVRLAGGKHEEDKESCDIEIEKAAAKVKQTKANVTEKKEENSFKESDSDNENLVVKDQSSLFDQKSLEDKILQSKQFFNKFYFRLTELVIPREGKTRAEAWKEILQLFTDVGEKNSTGLAIPSVSQEQPISQSVSQPQASAQPQIKPEVSSQPEAQTQALPKSQPAKHKFSLFNPMDRKALLQRGWMIGENLTGILAFIYFVYFIFGNFALRYQWGIFTDLATNTIQGNTVIPFFAFAFIFIRLLMWLREKFTSWSPIRTALLFLSGAILLIFMGLNLMH